MTSKSKLWPRGHDEGALHLAAAIWTFTNEDLGTRTGEAGYGYASLRVEADGGSYTVLVMADDPGEWLPSEARQLLRESARFCTRVREAVSAEIRAHRAASGREIKAIIEEAAA